MVALTPKMRAPKAIDSPWFPVDEATTPRSRSSAVSRETRLMPPRTLNAPVGRWFSCLTNTIASSSRPSGGYSRSGVGLRYGAIVVRASSTSANVGASTPYILKVCH